MVDLTELQNVHRKCANSIIDAALKFASNPDKLNLMGSRLMKHLDAFDTADLRAMSKDAHGNYDSGHMLGFISLFESRIHGIDKLTSHVGAGIADNPRYQQLMKDYIGRIVAEYERLNEFIVSL